VLLKGDHGSHSRGTERYAFRMTPVQLLQHCRLPQVATINVQAQKALEEKLEGDAFLQARVEKVTIGAHQKNVYSVHRCAIIPAAQC